MKMRNDLTAQYVRSILQYMPETGFFFWKPRSDVSPRGDRRTYKEAGFIHKKDGYRRIKINGISYLAHRLAWLWMTGKWPKHEIDHVKGTRSDNRWTELREATDLQTAQNAGKRQNATHPFKGIMEQRNGRFTARIRINKKLFYLGTYDTAEEAHASYKKAAAKYFQEFARFE